ncbi:hypothetical protein C0989_001947 [Termitomyces sp. Mn162]|nr:hypothetical protein C0989_001947 [Termitomyces sp. Mn162]
MVILAAVASGIVIGGLLIWHRAVRRAREDPALSGSPEPPSTVLSRAVQTPSFSSALVYRHHLIPQLLALPRDSVKLLFSKRSLPHTLPVLSSSLKNNPFVMFAAMSTSLTLNKLLELRQKYLNFYSSLSIDSRVPSSSPPAVRSTLHPYQALANDRIVMFAVVTTSFVVDKLSELR